MEEGRILIEGKIYSEFLETKDVTAKGTVLLKTQYEYKNEYESPHMYCSIDFYFVNSKCICTE